MATEESSIDVDAVRPYLDSVLDDPVTQIEVLSDGLNLMLGVSTGDGNLSYVVRRPTKLRETQLFTDLPVEYGILEGLEPTPVPAPVPIDYCDDATILGEQFYLMSALKGEGIHWGNPLPDRFDTPDRRRAVGEVIVDNLAELHALPTEPFADICTIQTPTDQIQMAQARLTTICNSLGREFPHLKRVGDLLEQRAPSSGMTRLVHGDYKPDNVFFGPSENPHLTGIVDWETAMLGEPLIEVGYLLLLWRDRTSATRPLTELQSEAPSAAVRKFLRDVEETGFWPFTLAEDTITRQDIVDRYEAATGFSYESTQFYQAFSAYMLGIVWSDLYRYDVQAGVSRDEPGYVTGIALIAEDILTGRNRL